MKEWPRTLSSHRVKQFLRLSILHKSYLEEIKYYILVPDSNGVQIKIPYPQEDDVLVEDIIRIYNKGFLYLGLIFMIHQPDRFSKTHVDRSLTLNYRKWENKYS